MQQINSVVMMGATGAVGGHVARTIVEMPNIERFTLLGRRPVEGITGNMIEQYTIDVFTPSSYQHLLAGHQTAICTFGVGQPSKMSKQEFIKIDRDAVLDFATACKRAGIHHFELLSSVGISSRSSSFYLRTKGELEDGLKALSFDRLSLFHPSAILTPTNRYGVFQAILLTMMPRLNPVLVGSLRKFRGIPVDRLGIAMAKNILADKQGIEILHWDDFMVLSSKKAIRL